MCWANIWHLVVVHMCICMHWSSLHEMVEVLMVLNDWVLTRSYIICHCLKFIIIILIKIFISIVHKEKLHFFCVFFNSCSCSSAWENTRARVPHSLQPYWIFLVFFARQNSPCFDLSFAYCLCWDRHCFVPIKLNSISHNYISGCCDFCYEELIFFLFLLLKITVFQFIFI